MMYNFSTILYHRMKKTTSNLNYIFEPKKTNTKIKTTNLTVDIEFENKKSLELYNKFNTKPKFSVLNTNTNTNEIFNKKQGFYIKNFIYICIFLASFSFRSVVI